MSHIFIFFILIYQRLISPLIPFGCCRFYPTCSAYSLESFQKHGTWNGIILTLKRILRCHPFNPGGYDPVP